MLAHVDDSAEILTARAGVVRGAAIPPMLRPVPTLPAFMRFMPHAYALLLAVCVRGSARTVWFILALHLARSASTWLAARWSAGTSRAVHSVLLDGAFAVAMAHAASWPWPAWLYLPLFMSSVFQPLVRARSRDIAFHRDALAQRERELAAAGEEIAALKRRLAECDKLTSLGMLAAGVAHEINNPMAYVTSNVRAFAETVRQLDPIPPALRD